ncbi:MAG: hypothetical protein HC811_13960 [Flammeovirgaceae bacterium]|nr:hypothetical protein [Flammeovirgaceae bacterium]
METTFYLMKNEELIKIKLNKNSLKKAIGFDKSFEAEVSKKGFGYSKEDDVIKILKLFWGMS